MGELRDLVCGPASPLPETSQRYRLVAHLGSGEQAEVYRAVRLCGGVTSAPMTVKVFRADPCRQLVDELRSWDKGDAVLMDLNDRGVPSICRRIDGFYGPPPHKPGEPPEPGNPVPYQIYDYLHGVDLRTYLSCGAASTTLSRNGGVPQFSSPGSRLNSIGALRTLAGVLRALHLPGDPGATPVLHLDVTPSNVMVLATGEVRLIDFTRARYWRPEEINQIAYPSESGGPEALGGHVGPAYDVHGFGAIAFFMVTGELPRGPHAPPPASHPLLSGRPALRDLLLGPLADRPEDRPSTAELSGWVDRLGTLVRAAGLPETGVDWAEPAADTAPTTGVAAPQTVAPTAIRVGPPRGRAPVVPRPPRAPDSLREPLEPPPVPHPPMRDQLRQLKRGGWWTWFGIAVAFLGWSLWAVANRGHSLFVPLLAFVVVLAVGGGLFVVLRLLGRLVIERWLGRRRRGAVLAHVGTALYLVTVGIEYLHQTPWVVHAVAWVRDR